VRVLVGDCFVRVFAGVAGDTAPRSDDIADTLRRKRTHASAHVWHGAVNAETGEPIAPPTVAELRATLARVRACVYAICGVDVHALV
jgi:hypothetical protein